MFNFEKLTVWQKSIDYADQIFSLTKSFPQDERFGLTSQLRRAAVSVSSNIAEGSSRSSNNDFSRFIEITYGSLMETISQAKIASRQGLVDSDEYDELYLSGEEIARMLSGLRASLKSREGREKSRENKEIYTINEPNQVIPDDFPDLDQAITKEP